MYSTRLAVCDCLSFTFRPGDLPSPLIAIFTFRVTCTVQGPAVIKSGNVVVMVNNQSSQESVPFSFKVTTVDVGDTQIIIIFNSFHSEYPVNRYFGK